MDWFTNTETLLKVKCVFSALADRKLSQTNATGSTNKQIFLFEQTI